MTDIYLYIILTDFILIFNMYLYNHLCVIIPLHYLQSNKLQKNVIIVCLVIFTRYINFNLCYLFKTKYIFTLY